MLQASGKGPEKPLESSTQETASGPGAASSAKGGSTEAIIGSVAMEDSDGTGKGRATFSEKRNRLS